MATTTDLSMPLRENLAKQADAADPNNQATNLAERVRNLELGGYAVEITTDNSVANQINGVINITDGEGNLIEEDVQVVLSVRSDAFALNAAAFTVTSPDQASTGAAAEILIDVTGGSSAYQAQDVVTGTTATVFLVASVVGSNAAATTTATFT